MSSFDFEDHDQGPPQDDDKNLLHVTTNEDGSCGNGWVCEHRWIAHRGMVGFRNAVAGKLISGYKLIICALQNYSFRSQDINYRFAFT